MYINIATKARADRRIHRSYDFLEDFYLNQYPKKRALMLGVAVISILLNLCLIIL